MTRLRTREVMGASAQRWDPERYRRNASFVAEGGEPLIEGFLAPQPGERILDLGCGDGALTARIAAHSIVVGVDASAEQVAAARARRTRRPCDGCGDSALCRRDSTPSSATPPCTGCGTRTARCPASQRALKPGGRFVAECGGEGNVEAVRAARSMPRSARRGLDAAPCADPWHFPSAAAYRRAGSSGTASRCASIDRFERPTPLPGPLGDWLDTFG